MNSTKVVSQLRSIFSIVFIAALMCLSALAQQEGTLSGTLLDPQGVSVSNNIVELRWNDVGSSGYALKRKIKKHITTNTDSAGRFQLKLFPGDYDVFVYRDGFAPVCTIVFVETGAMKSVELRLPSLAPQRITNEAK